MNESLMLTTYNSISIGHVSHALETEVEGTWGQEVHIHHVDIYNMIKNFVLFLVVVIGLSPNSVSQLYCSKDNYKQKQRNTLPVTMITEIMHFIRLLWRLPWHRRLVLVFGDLH